RQTGQLPLYYNHKRNGRGIDEYYEPSFYLNYHDITAAPLFPFGYGLSYTTFKYDALSVKQTPDEVKVLVEVKNNGMLEGEEIVQCYLQDEVSSSTRPIRELVGFKRILLKPQEKIVVTFMLGDEELGFYNRRGDFVVEPGNYTIYVGTNSQTPLKIRFNR
ncbi:MAG: fibronectin type III-like domain-contianing protein, partial [Turicibacter sp.]